MISLRPLAKDDINLVFEWENLPELWQFSEQRGPFSREDIASFMGKCLDNNNTEIERWLICNTSMPIGAVDVFDYDLHNHTCGLGIFITYPENRKQGQAAIALKKALSILRARGALLIRAIIYEDNTSSRRLFLSAGFRQGATTFYKGKPAIQFFWTPQA